MENVIKGWITSIVGLIIIGCAIAHYFGFYTFTNPGSLSTNKECLIAGIIGLGLFLIPATRLESIIEGIINKKADDLTK